MSRRVAIGGLGTIGLSVANWLVQADGFDLAAVRHLLWPLQNPKCLI